MPAPQPERIGSVEQITQARGFRWIIGVDEVGRGPLVGPVTTAAVLLDLEALDWCEGLDDSKKLSAARRAELSARGFERAVSATVMHIHADEVDERNVLGASLYGMERCARALLDAAPPAVEAFDASKVLVAVDGRQRLREFDGPQEAFVRGDARSWAIAAASIIAKHQRDAWMIELHGRFPHYGFDRNKGYPTPQHLRALAEHGPLDCHRRSFAPVQATIARDDR